MEIYGERFLHSHRGTASPDISGKGKKFLDVYKVAFLVARDLGCGLKVYLGVTWHHTYEMSASVPLQVERLEHPLHRLTELPGHVTGGQVILIHLVRNQFILYACLVQQTGGIGLLQLHCQSPCINVSKRLAVFSSASLVEADITSVLIRDAGLEMIRTISPVFSGSEKSDLLKNIPPPIG